jgi:ankyrin repeat protein
LSAVEALLDAEPDLVHSENCDGWTPLIYASINGHAEVARCLLERGSHVDATEMGGCTALYQTAFDGHVEVAKVLLSHGADPDIHALDGMTALMQAAAAGHEGLVHVLLTHGADVDGIDERDMTALLHACERGHAGVVVTLLQGGADDQSAVFTNWTQKPATGKGIAKHRGHGEVVKVLEVRGPVGTGLSCEHLSKD